MVLLDNREVRQGWEPLKQAVTGMFEKHGGEVVSARRWDERRLAYPIRGQLRGTYLLVYYKSAGDGNVLLRRDLELSEPVLRHMITVCEEVPEQAYEPEAEFDPMSVGVEEVAAAPEESTEESSEESSEESTEETSEESTEETAEQAKAEEAAPAEEAPAEDAPAEEAAPAENAETDDTTAEEAKS